MKKKNLVLATFLLAGFVKLLADPLEGDVRLTYPLTVKKLENIYIDARLYEYDPWLADAPATLVDHVELEEIDLSRSADSIVDIHFFANRKSRMKYYVTASTYSKKGGTLYFYINGFQKIFERSDIDDIDVTMEPKLETKKPKGEPEKVGGNDDEDSGKKSDNITGIYRAVEIEWEGEDGSEFALQKSTDLKSWETIETLSGTGEKDSVFIRVYRSVQFWRLQPE
ncbi:MAG TPA: hypothetical protein DCO70_04270 [Verrucomicrobiales bacterium]|jgi:hypothetical protein|nr:hypothetical protein [Verrucomicrobiales bacterium]HAH98526.1 hypothetical protein [Verrucomicrobiales bacterium]|tara:strand:- start:965 stop:1639 length:675 start_codon:yes stop_codon:yes gene_type:complete